MNDVQMLTVAVLHVVRAHLGRLVPSEAVSTEVRDRGAVSLEQVLWFVAAGVSVAVIAAILWGRIRTEANNPITTPTAP
ncbi:MAG: hypothetical protein MUE78_13500 [Ilumatobacteraceae bacterium]|jgi:hypothetical protein|nr:hypothetical protein [Ilumatobacteraceae bacterium]